MREDLVLSPRAKYIWAKNNTQADDKVIFRRWFEADPKPEKARAYLFSETKYWLYINEELVVFEGGLFRESKPGCGYADEVDLAPYLKPGQNLLAAVVFYYGNEGRNNTDSGQAGFLLDCEALQLYSDDRFFCKRHGGYYHVEDSRSSHLFGGWDLGVLADSPDHGFFRYGADENGYVPATEYENTVWGSCCLRPVPLIRRFPGQSLPFSVISGCEAVVKLPYAMAFSPRFRVEAAGGEKIILQTDRYEVPGGPGDQHNRYYGLRIEYICKAGINEFESLQYLYGEAFFLSSDKPVRILETGVVESGYNCEQTLRFSCSCPVMNALIQKSIRTLYVCMRDNFMDCPDRERGQWIGDATVQTPQAILAFDERAALLVRKAILDFILLRKGDMLTGNVPGADFSELPGQSLTAIGTFGMIAEYVRLTGDKSVLPLALEPAVKYLMLWETDGNGRLLPREGNWRWFDHLFNADEPVLENALYYSALRFAADTAKELDVRDYDDFLDRRRKDIEKRFETEFWNGRFYTSDGRADDRANAIAVLAGLVPKNRFIQIRFVLQSVQTASIYMEYFVLKALCEMGYYHDAYLRMRSRYYNLAVNENTTLWEDFNVLGTKNHAWSGGPLNIVLQYFAGITTDDGFQNCKINPICDLFSEMNVSFCVRGKRTEICVQKNQAEIHNHL